MLIKLFHSIAGYYKNLHLDVDIASTNRTFDDNLPHKLRLDFNRREMNFTVDNITRIVEFHYQYGITHLDVDGSPFYIGGRNDGLEEGFMGIIRGFVSSCIHSFLTHIYNR